MSVSVLNAVSSAVSAAGTEGVLANSGISAEGEASFVASFSEQMQTQEPLQEGTAVEKIASLLRGQKGQSFSALLGDSLPSIQTQDINLDETLTALNDVLAHLDGLKLDDTKLALEDISATLAQEHRLMSGTDPTDDPEQAPLSSPLINDNAAAGQQESSDIDHALLNVFNGLPQMPTDALSGTRAEPEQVENDLDSSAEALPEALMMPINIVDQAAASTVTENVQHLVASAEASIPQFIRQEKTISGEPAHVSNVLSAEASDENLHEGAGLDNLLRRESLLSADRNNLGELSAEKLPTRLPELQGTTAGITGAETLVATADREAHSFLSSDLSALSRQVETTLSKQELPAMTKPFNHPEWKQEFNERIIWMHAKAIPSAELRLNPQHLGPVSIQINVDTEQQASILFHAQHASVRDAIEAALPRLREMLNAQQVTLTDANVSQQQQQGEGSARQAMQDVLGERQRNGKNNTSASNQADLGINEIAEEINQGRAVASKGLLSLYV